MKTFVSAVYFIILCKYSNEKVRMRHLAERRLLVDTGFPHILFYIITIYQLFMYGIYKHILPFMIVQRSK